ncbi:MAG: LuxR C-terminal-related transcriptional regulator [Verrucomicrobiales bacterium]|nr:LuxR C-terminal-related transcriptional regulator [Verrucomicrobiales bacterium]
MLVDRRDINRKLERIAARICRDPSWHDDLVQEAEIHFWQMHRRNPGHTQSWYLQSCSFHLRKIVNAGKSLDSPKRAALRLTVPENSETDDSAALPASLFQESFYETLCAQDFISQLLRRLKRLDCKILIRLAEGDTVSEIARQLCVSHTSVAKHRRRIIRQACELGLISHRRS